MIQQLHHQFYFVSSFFFTKITIRPVLLLWVPERNEQSLENSISSDVIASL